MGRNARLRIALWIAPELGYDDGDAWEPRPCETHQRVAWHPREGKFYCTDCGTRSAPGDLRHPIIVGPTVIPPPNYHVGTRYVHEEPRRHRVAFQQFGTHGLQRGEVLVTTPCGYVGWVRGEALEPADNIPACAICRPAMVP